MRKYKGSVAEAYIAIQTVYKGRTFTYYLSEGDYKSVLSQHGKLCAIRSIERAFEPHHVVCVFKLKNLKS